MKVKKKKESEWKSFQTNKIGEDLAPAHMHTRNVKSSSKHITPERNLDLHKGMKSAEMVYMGLNILQVLFLIFQVS